MAQTQSKITQDVNFSEPYLDVDFYFQDGEGFDWKCCIFLDVEINRWSQPTYMRSEGPNDSFEEIDTDMIPPEILTEYVNLYLAAKSEER